MGVRQSWKWSLAAVASLYVLCGAGSAVATVTATSVVAEFNATLLSIMRATDGATTRERFQLLSAPVERTFNIRYMAEQIVGRRWTAASDDERRSLVAAFARISIGTFLTRFGSYEGETFRVLDERDGGQGRRLVLTEFVRPGRSPIAVTYVTRAAGEGWRVVDLLIGGAISEVAMRRSEVSLVLSRNGISGLIRTLNQKADFLLGGREPSVSQASAN